MSKTILIVAAHPDDEVLGCFGTVAKLIKQGYTAYTLILSGGKTSRGRVEQWELDNLKEEMYRANKLIGIKEVYQADFPDNAFDSVPLLSIVKKIEEIKNKVKPEIVFTHHFGDMNVDHQLTYKAVLTATRPIKGDIIEAIYAMEIPSSTEWNSYSKESVFVPNIFFDITDTIEDKVNALNIYQSELREYPHPRSLRHIKELAKVNGTKVGLEYSENFMLVRRIKKNLNINGKGAFNIRLANSNDIKNVFDLFNDDFVRKHSLRSQKISWDEHQQWYTNRLRNTDSPFYIIEDENNDFIGQVRIDNTDETIISISLTQEYRGQRLSSEILKLCSEKCGFDNIVAYVKESNERSLRAFKKAGYKLINIDNGICKLVYTKSVYIIAEMSANHCGDKELAKKIIAKAKECGADAVKIQTYTADTMTIDCKTDIFKVKGGTLWDGKYLYDLYKEAYTPWEWQKELKEYADSIGIDFFSTPFDKTAVDFLENMNVTKYKIASFEAIDYPLIKYAASKGKPMIISTGISTLEEIQEAINVCKSAGNNDITILKCTSAYPAELKDMNLITIKDMYERFAPQGVKIGLSDHTMNIETPIAAVALGATVIEKHFTLDRSLGGADADFSLNPEKFSAMVNAVRNTQKLLGTVNYEVNPDNKIFARSLFAVKDIKKGDKFTPENIRSIRPGSGLHPKYYDEILQKTATQDISRGTPLKTEYFK